MAHWKSIFGAMVVCLLALRCAGQQSPEEIFKLAKGQYNQSDWNGAITNFTKTIEARFDLYNSYSYRAYALAQKGDSNGAIADCNQVIKLNPNCSCGYYWRSRVEYELTNFDGAIADFETGLRLDAKDRPTDLATDLSVECQNRAWQKLNMGDLSAAMTNYNEAIRIAPTNRFPYELRGLLKVTQKHFDSAIADAYQAIRFSGANSDAFAYEVRAWARYGRGDVSGAAEDCRKVAEIDSKARAKHPSSLPSEESEWRTTAGLLAFINGDFEQSVEKWNKFEEADINTNMPPALRDFLQSWIEEAKAKLAAAKPKS